MLAASGTACRLGFAPSPANTSADNGRQVSPGHPQKVAFVVEAMLYDWGAHGRRSRGEQGGHRLALTRASIRCARYVQQVRRMVVRYPFSPVPVPPIPPVLSPYSLLCAPYPLLSAVHPRSRLISQKPCSQPYIPDLLSHIPYPLSLIPSPLSRIPYPLYLTPCSLPYTPYIRYPIPTACPLPCPLHPVASVVSFGARCLFFTIFYFVTISPYRCFIFVLFSMKRYAGRALPVRDRVQHPPRKSLPGIGLVGHPDGRPGRRRSRLQQSQSATPFFPFSFCGCSLLQ